MVIITVTTPILIGLHIENRRDVLKKYIARFIPQGIFFISILLLLSTLILPFIIPAIFGNDFKNSILPAQILFCGLVYSCVSCFYSGILTTFKLIKRAVAINITMAILNFFGDMILVPIMGINGAAVSTVTVFLIGSFAYMYSSNRFLKLSAYKSLLFFIPATLLLFSLLLRVNVFLSLSAIILIYYLILISSRLFKISDTVLLENISMPRFVRNSIRFIYKILDKGK
jgi:O-antigen/teichoic acid export membrane protein